MTDKIKTSAQPGSLRKEMTKEEREWLENFNLGTTGRSEKHLEKICDDPQLRRRIVSEEILSHQAKHRDLMNKGRRVYDEMDPDTAVELEQQRVTDKAEAYIEQKYVKPKIKTNRYSEKDYQKESFPNEDGLIDLIDADIAAEQAKKVKQFPGKKESK